jgi:hypothetical protein
VKIMRILLAGPLMLTLAVLPALASATPVRSAGTPLVHWQLRSVPPPGVSQPHAELFSVSCPTHRFCLAVGDRVTTSGFLAPLVEVRTGDHWALGKTAGLPKGTAGLDQVSCARRSRCVALAGTPGGPTDRPVMWTGTRWASAPLPHPRIDAPMDVACANSVCLVVGARARSAAAARNGNFGSAAAWRSAGRTWMPVRVPLMHRSHLVSVSCPAARSCYAAGWVTAATAPKVRMLVDHWNGSRWAAAPTPATLAANLNDISCPTLGSCTAVGAGGHPDFGGRPLVATLRGGHWRLGHPTLPRSAATLDTISCRTAHVCVATVDYLPNDDTGWTLAFRGPSGSFHSSARPAEAPVLSDVSCARARCTVVGSTWLSGRGAEDVANAPTAPVALTGAGPNLVRQSVPAPRGTVDAMLSSVSCTAGFCAAVSDAGRPPTLVRPDGGSWRRVPNSGVADLTGVACTSNRFCAAVTQGRWEHWTGRVWIQAPLPTPNGSTADVIYGVSCVHADWCDAVGTTGDASFPKQPLVEHWDGSSWQVAKVPDAPKRFRFNQLTAISCTTTSSCLAVGYAVANGAPIVESWDGTAWRRVSTKGLPTHAALGSVSCWAATGCVVSSDPDSAFGQDVVATWNGTSFTPTTMARPNGATFPPDIFAVGCRAANDCVAVGRDGSTVHALVEAWNGTAWRVLSGPNVAGSQSEFRSVSCAPKRCWAVGEVWRQKVVAISAVIE